jgi:hypothetical protein
VQQRMHVRYVFNHAIRCDQFNCHSRLRLLALYSDYTTAFFKNLAPFGPVIVTLANIEEGESTAVTHLLPLWDLLLALAQTIRHNESWCYVSCKG